MKKAFAKRGRKPYPKHKLTEAEHDFVCLMADTTQCNWFTIAGSTIDLATGKRLHFKSDEYDCVYDLERRRFISLQYGLRLLMEAFEGGGHLDGLRGRSDELKVWNRLCEIVRGK